MAAEDMRRKHYQVGASLDFVKDYRELGALPAWDDALARHGADMRVLDVCCGTGRWAQAFSEHLLTRRNVKVAASFTDICEDSLEVLRKRLPALAGFSVEKVVQANIGAEQDKQRLPNDAFDVVTNMHGLYGLPAVVLPAAIDFMASKLKSDGQLIVALGSEDSLYQRIPAALHDLGMLGKRYSSVFEVLAACKELGLEVTADSLVYHEEYSSQDRAGLERFVMEECVGNTFSVEDAPQFTTENVFKVLEPLLSSYYHEASDTFRFRQDVSVLHIRRAKMPDVVSDRQRSAASYELRESVLTAQSNALS